MLILCKRKLRLRVSNLFKVTQLASGEVGIGTRSKSKDCALSPYDIQLLNGLARIFGKTY